MSLGHLILDEDLERTTFIVGCGLIGPMEIVSVIISTTLELPTLENGAIRVVYPTVLTPIVRSHTTASKTENGGKSEETGYPWWLLYNFTLKWNLKKRCMRTDAFSLYNNKNITFLRATSCFGATSGKQDRSLGSEQQCCHHFFTSPAANLAPYELSFQLLVRGACLLAGRVFFKRILAQLKNIMLKTLMKTA